MSVSVSKFWVESFQNQFLETFQSFAKRIRLTRVRLIHGDRAPADLDLGDQKSFATRFVVPLAGMGSGLYRIEWRGLSGDGHAVRNAFTFRVQ